VLTAALLALTFVANAEPALPEVVRLHAERVHAQDLIVPDRLLHLVWKASKGAEALEEFVGESVAGWSWQKGRSNRLSSTIRMES